MKTRLLKRWAVYSFEDGSVIGAFASENKARLLCSRLNEDAPEAQAYVRLQRLDYAALPVDEMPPDRS